METKQRPLKNSSLTKVFSKLLGCNFDNMKKRPRETGAQSLLYPAKLRMKHDSITKVFNSADQAMALTDVLGKDTIHLIKLWLLYFVIIGLVPSYYILLVLCGLVFSGTQSTRRLYFLGEKGKDTISFEEIKC